jgi:5'(3')-deoxyribonucleotidase
MKIAIDMDGVLANFVKLACAKASELWDIDFRPEHVTDYSFAKTIQDAGVKLPKTEIYTELTGPGIFADLEPYNGAVKAVHDLHKAGHDIVILTKALLIDRHMDSGRFASDHAVSEKLDWLAAFFGDIPYSVIMVGEANDKHLVNCHMIVDDDPRVLEHPTAITVCVAQTWNEAYRKDLGEFLTIVHHMSELPEVAERVESILRTQEAETLDTLEAIQREVGINESKVIKSGSRHGSN